MIRLIPYVCLVLAIVDRTAHGLTSSICARVPEGNFVRSSQSCNSYNRCINGRPQHGVCPKGTSFASRTQMCDTNIEVDCRVCSPYGIQNIPNPDDCQLFYRCVNGVRTSMICSNGLLFDRKYGDCNLASKVQCEAKNSICEPFRSLGYITVGDPLDCTSYYQCLNGNAFETTCPAGLYYNPYAATCEEFGNFCQGMGPLITTPAPVTTTREYVTTAAAPTTAKTTVRVVYFTTPATS